MVSSIAEGAGGGNDPPRPIRTERGGDHLAQPDAEEAQSDLPLRAAPDDGEPLRQSNSSNQGIHNPCRSPNT